jgi:hypothetical protein
VPCSNVRFAPEAPKFHIHHYANSKPVMAVRPMPPAVWRKAQSGDIDADVRVDDLVT